MDNNVLEDIYRTLTGFYTPEAALPGVPDLFAPYSPCEREYARMRQAYERICIRLGVNVDDEDEDLNIMVEAMESIQEVLCKEMFRLGLEFRAGH